MLPDPIFHEKWHSSHCNRNSIVQNLHFHIPNKIQPDFLPFIISKSINYSSDLVFFPEFESR